MRAARCAAVGGSVILMMLGLASEGLAQVAGSSALPPAVPPAARGIVRRADGRPMVAATVYLLETLEEARTDSSGHFVLRVGHRGIGTLVARALGHLPTAVDVVFPLDTSVVLTLVTAPPRLSAVTVVSAGEYRVGSGQRAAITPLEIVQMPGAAANVARALQALPGVQAVDEGTGLFVRGGDVSETRVLVDDAWMLSPVRVDNPTGHTTSTLNPFLLERTDFLAGAFGASRGNALSGVVHMHTANPSPRHSASLSASIGSWSANAATRPMGRFSARAAIGWSDLSALVAAFGSNQPYAPTPTSGFGSATAEWRTSVAGRVRLFAVDQRGRFGVGEATDQATAGGAMPREEDGRYRATTNERMTVLSWRDSSTRWRPSVTAAWSTHTRDEAIGPLYLGTALDAPQVIVSLARVMNDGSLLRIGGERESLEAQYDGELRGTARNTLFDVRATNRRTAVFVERERVYRGALRVVTGLRSDHHTITDRRTFDPRVSLAWQHRAIGLTAAWGRYHQVAEPLFRRTSDARSFSPMRATQWTLGLQWGSDTAGLRVEWFDKQYTDLWQLNRERNPIGQGHGFARGADAHWRWPLGANGSMRMSYSHVRARRSDPELSTTSLKAGPLAPTPADIAHSLVTLMDWRIRTLTLSSAWRAASGRPYTEITGWSAQSSANIPIYGPSFGSRLPRYQRWDVSASWYRALGAQRGLVVWGSLANLLGRDNVMRYRWTPNTNTRTPILAPFNRSLFVGSTLLL
ncbi:MAG: TonB-dependent receptor [Gemmatimonadaceae bacterium]|nr:TonB-dependent receptor [Gemmatimonadaceae bacterium]